MMPVMSISHPSFRLPVIGGEVTVRLSEAPLSPGATMSVAGEVLGIRMASFSSCGGVTNLLA
jgi:hypothetical protein